MSLPSKPSPASGPRACPGWLLQPGAGMGRGPDRGISSFQRTVSKREGEKGEKAKVKGAGSPCEEAQIGKEISR